MATSTGLYDTSTLTYDTSTSTYDGYPSPLSTMPALGVYIAWADSPYTASPAWTDVTYLVRSISVRRGRSDDLQQFGPGQASVTFDNRDRLFDPFNTSGTWYSSLKPRRGIKIVGLWNGVEYPVFRGFVSGWPVEYTEAGLDSTVTVDCFDLFGLMGAELFDADRYKTAIQSLTPRTYWTFNELAQTASGTPTVYDLGTDNKTPPIDLTIQSVGSNNVRGVTSPMFQPDGFLDKTYTVSGDAELRDFSISFWGQTLDGRVGTDGILNFFGGSGTSLLTSRLSILFSVNYATPTAQQFSVYVYGNTSSGTNAESDSTKLFADNSPHHVVINYQPAVGQFRIWVDGVDVTNVKVTVTNVRSIFPIRSFLWHEGVVYPGGSGRSPSYSKTGITQVAMFDRALTSDEIMRLYQLGYGYKSESSYIRAVALINETLIPATLTNFSSSVSATLGDNVINGKAVLSALQKVANSEGGALFCSSSGIATMIGRDGWFTGRQATSQCTFTDTGTGVSYDAQGIRMRYDAEQVRNEFNVSTDDGFTGLARSTDSITANGVASENLSTYSGSAIEAQALADRNLAIYKNPKMQVDPFTVKGQANPTYNWPRILSLELLDRVTFKRTPATGSAIQKDMLVQAVEHRITPETWETTVTGSTRYTGWFILGVSLLGSSEDVLL